MAVVFQKFDYFEGDKLFYVDNRTSNYTQNEAYGKLSAGFPLTMKGRMEVGFGYGLLSDNYFVKRGVAATNNDEDESNFTIGSAFIKLESNTLDNLMYPVKGYNYQCSFQGFKSKESYTSSINPNKNAKNINDYWLQAKTKIENYTPINQKLTVGSYLEIALSNRSLLNNYTVSVIQAPSFRPTPHSRTVFNEAYSANKFIAIGIKPIYKFTNDFHIRNEAYWFIPYKTILPAEDMTAYFSKPYSSSHFLNETSLVYNFKFASAAMFVNYYSASLSKWNFGINIGFLLFNPKFTE